MRFLLGILAFIFCMGFAASEALSSDTSLVGVWDVRAKTKIAYGELIDGL